MNTADKLREIQESSGLTQEQLAQRLSVTFATLNSWMRGRSNPRKKAIEAIDILYLEIVGREDVDADDLEKLIDEAQSCKMTARQMVEDKRCLDLLTLHLTYHTNNIEGSTMTLSDVEKVIFDNKVLSNRTAIEQAEARNHQATFYWLIDKIASSGDAFVIDEDLIRGIHVRLMNGILSDAGLYRSHAVRISGSSVVLTNAVKIDAKIQELVKDLEIRSKEVIRHSARAHACFEQIHPFSDGNGRTGRLLMFAQVLSRGMMPPLISKERKKFYYKALEIAQTQENFMHLELLLAESIKYTFGLLNRNNGNADFERC